MKALVIICDGMGDRPSKNLGGLTPLQAARSEGMDWVARNGECGLMDPISPGIVPGSDTSHLAILGYDPTKYYAGRGAYEALGIGMDVKPGDVAFRCNFATVSNDGIVVDRRAGRISSEEAEALSEGLKEVELKTVPGVKVRFVHTVEHRGILLLSGDGLSPNVTDVDLHATGVKYGECVAKDGSEDAKRTAMAVNEFVNISKKLLDNHPINASRKTSGKNPANILLPRGAGSKPSMEPFNEKHKVRGAAVAAGPVYRGIFKAAGLTLATVKGATATVSTDVNAKFEAAINLLKDHDIVFLHIKGTDSASHDRDSGAKVNMIRRIGDAISRYVKEIDVSSTYLVLTSDHSTPVDIGEHRADPVPIAIAGPDVRKGLTEYYDELSCARGILGRIKGIELMPILTSFLGKFDMFGE